MPNLFAERAAGFLRQVEPVSALEGLESVRPEPVTGFDALSSDEKKAVEGALGKLDEPARMDDYEQSALEAIIIPDRRPVINVADDDYAIAEHDWKHLNGPEYRAAILPTLPAIGRLELIGHPGIPYAGTAFLVGPDLLMTNRHVAELFAAGLGRSGIAFKPGLSSKINFAEEALRTGDTFYPVAEVLVIHPWWDMAVLRVEGVPDTIRPLTLSRDGDAPGAGEPDVVVVGYPAFDPRRNDIDVQRRVFGNLFNVKRLQPGKLLPRRPVASFGKDVDALTHDSSTLGGNSGSAVIDARTGRVMALHFGGRYLETNYGVPAADLALDARLLDLGLAFESGPPLQAADGSWAGAWDALEGQEGSRPGFPLTPPTRTGQPVPAPVPAPVPPPLPAPAPAPAAAAGDGATFTIPLVITVRTAAPVPGITLTAASATSGEAIVEKMAEPWHDDSYRGRKGYRADFLGPEVPLPTPLDPKSLATLEDGSHVIPYMHFSLAMHRGRRLALYTAANVRADRGSRNPEPGRNTTRKGLSGLGEYDTEKWFTDPRLRGLDQLPDKFFTLDRQSFDKGHLVRRDDVAWGETFDELRIANGDTYHVTNCSPQVAGFNRAHGGDNWGDLEKAVLAQAVDQRLIVLAGPVLADDDPDFSGVDDAGAVRVRIPRAYWKVVVAPRSEEGGDLAAFGFLLEQDLSAVAMERLDFDPRWHASMRSLSDLERVIGLLTFPEILHRADRHGTAAAEAVAGAAGLED